VVDIKRANVFAVAGNIMITGIDTPQLVEIYNAQGSLVKSITVNNGEVISGLAKSNLYIVKISNQSYKIVL
ncbi:MAG: T9SS type A sorting domain-containing protein, partial [Muribaculaceae bacterium]|nr:T9SS type A sorting domain-containing protein [Muribaculaceae bacterium]